MTAYTSVPQAAEILCPEIRQPLRTVSFSANAIADCVNDLARDTKPQLKETCEAWRVRLRLVGVQALQPLCSYLVSFEASSQLELPACPGNLRTGPFERKSRA